MKGKSPSRVRLLVTPWTAAYQAPPSMGFSRQEDWSGVPLPSPILFPDLILISAMVNTGLKIFETRFAFSLIFGQVEAICHLAKNFS